MTTDDGKNATAVATGPHWREGASGGGMTAKKRFLIAILATGQHPDREKGGKGKVVP
jgi:hypothetical protein